MDKNKYLGCIYGLAIGDALGFPIENTNIMTLLFNTDGKGITDFVRPYMGPFKLKIGSYSDDTQLSLAIAKALLNSNLEDYDINEIMDNVSEEFIDWYFNSNYRNPGHACTVSAWNLEIGKHWSESAAESVYLHPDAKGSGAAMRTAPIGLMFHDDLDKLIEVASTSSKCTHPHPTAISAGIATAYLTSLALQGVNPNEWIGKIQELDCFNDEFKTKIKQLEDLIPLENKYLALSRIGEGWKAEEIVATALYSVLKHPSDYEQAVLQGANTNGDSDSIACIAGAISGAYNGVENIPERWIKNIEDSELLRKTAELLYEKKARLKESKSQA